MPTTTTDILIVGAGAAGLWAAAVCARAGRETIVLEKTGRTGTKVLASGGSRCNLTTTLNARKASQLFGAEGGPFVSPAFRALPPSAVRKHFHGLGVPTTTEDSLEKVFPTSNKARDVRDALLRDATEAGAQFVLNRAVESIAAHEGGWRVQTHKGAYQCRALLLCCGGKSFPKTGTTGDGYTWLRDLGLTMVRPLPALVPLVSPAAWAKELSGLSVDAEVRIGKYRRRRPVLFTHRGLSGPGPMDASVHIVRSPPPVDLLLDLMPDHSWEAVRELLTVAASKKGAPKLAKLIPLQRRLLAAVCIQAGLDDPNPHMAELSKARRNQLVNTLKGLPVPIHGTTGFDHAEVTAGGLALSEVNRKTMEVNGHPGLYVFGELLDLSGPIGGLNFQAAFSTAELAGLAAVRGATEST